jgi:hypothetical protein
MFVVMESKTTPHCLSCNTPLTGKYCSACGEKTLEPHEKSLRFFLSRVLDALTFADVKGLKSFWLLVRRPGLLSASYNQGIRKRYYLPLNLFLLTNFIYFLLPIFNTFNTDYRTQKEMQLYSKFTHSWLTEQQLASGLSEQDYAAAYNAKSENLAKLLMLAFALFFAFNLFVIFYRKNGFFTDYLALSLEFSSFLVFYCTILLPLPVMFIYRLTGYSAGDDELSLGILLICLTWLYVATRRHFGLKPVWAVTKAALSAVALFYTLVLYRLLLLFATVFSL